MLTTVTLHCCIYFTQLEQERLDLQTQVCLLKENKEAVEEELKARSAAVVHNAEEAAQQRAESNALRFVLTCYLYYCCQEVSYKVISSYQSNELHYL